MRYILASWCSEGFECLQDITKYKDFEAHQIFKLLDNKEPATNPLDQLMNSLIMRARFNTQRQYEIYVFTTDDSITLEDVESMSRDSPQFLADFARANGTKFFSDRQTTTPKIR